MKLSTCHPNRKAQARGLCKNCYDKWLKANNESYRQAQIKNTTKWSLVHPDQKKKHYETRKAKIKNDPDSKLKEKNRHLIYKYGITIENYNEILKKQNGVCAICHRAPGKIALHTDHCHETGKVRGLLCHQCNWYLGTIDADPDIIGRIISYREEDSKKPHLAHALACLGIIVDAKESGNLIDDRPLPGPASRLIAELEQKKKGTGK